jgi:hypothetical protein
MSESSFCTHWGHLNAKVNKIAQKQSAVQGPLPRREDGGLQDPIITHDDMILDGRNRYRACQQLGLGVRLRVDCLDGTRPPPRPARGWP